METRNSLTKALQQMGFAKAVSRKENETVAWQKREREYLTKLCREHGIEIEVLGVERDNLSLPEYKAAMQEVEMLEQTAKLIEEHNQILTEKAEELIKQVDALEDKDKTNRELIEKFDLRASTLKTISRETEAETKGMKSVAVPVNSLFGGGEYVKVKKSDWDKIMDVFGRAISRDKLLDRYEKKISVQDNMINTLKSNEEKLKRFIDFKGLGGAFVEFVKSLEPKTLKQKLEEKKADMEKNRQKPMVKQHEVAGKKRQLQQEI
jgi:hypothetical protein